MLNVLITGGTGKIAKEIIKGLLDDGHKVFFTSTSQEKISNLINHFEINQNLMGIVLDFFEETNLSNWSVKLNAPVEVVIHNARTLSSLINDENGFASKENFSREFEMAVVFPYLLNQALLEAAHPLRDIIFISSMYGSVAPTPALYDNFEKQSPIQYGVAKSAQIHLTKELAVRLSNKNIRVNCVSYGGVKGRVTDEFLKRYEDLTPMRRMLIETDIYPPIQFIINNPNLAVTGENIKVDGGWTIW
jgi:NAD(P)-dependent dehydrogenase (short-subunit alcohol dehydrogenase family)